MSHWQVLVPFLTDLRLVRAVLEYDLPLTPVPIQEFRAENDKFENGQTGLDQHQRTLKYSGVPCRYACEVTLKRWSGQACVYKERGAPPDLSCQVDQQFELTHILPPHPYVISPFAYVYDSHDDEDHTFVVCGLLFRVEGKRSLATYSSYVDEIIPASPGHLVTLVKQLLAGLQHLHAHQIIHHDLCGENILVDAPDLSFPNCEPPKQLDMNKIVALKIMDLGVAEHALVGDEDRRFCGHYRHGIPEQQTGSTLPITTALDIFGLGDIIRTLLFHAGQFSELVIAARLVRNLDLSRLTPDEQKQLKDRIDIVVGKTEKCAGHLAPQALLEMPELCQASDPAQRPTAQQLLSRLM